MVMGIVRITKMGLRIALRKASTKATIMAVRKPSIYTPGNKYDVTITAKAETNNLIIKFIFGSFKVQCF